MRKVFLLLTGMGFGFLTLWILIGGIIGSAEELPPVSLPLTSAQAPFGVERVEYIKPANIVFPFRIPGTDLIADRIVMYEGGYLEDNSNEEVVDIAALEVRNVGDTVLTSAKIVLERDGVTYTFRGSFIPTDCPVLLLESERRQCIYQNFTACSGSQSREKDSWLKPGELGITAISMGTVRVTNNTSDILTEIMLYYKNFLPGTEIYVGGITRKYRIPSLGPGESTEINPNYFARDYSRFLGATAKNTPEN